MHLYLSAIKQYSSCLDEPKLDDMLCGGVVDTVWIGESPVTPVGSALRLEGRQPNEILWLIISSNPRNPFADWLNLLIEEQSIL